jgi:guanylate kinase
VGNNHIGKIIVVSAPSGAGKTTLLNYVRVSMPELVYSISATTRPPRSHEKEGEHYFFLSIDEFKARIETGEFAEWQVVHGNYYGTPKSFVEQTIGAGKHLVMDIDVWGKAMLDKSYPQAYGILILPPSFDVLEERLRSRSTEREEDIELRLENSRKEIDFAKSHGTYAFTIINDDLVRAQEEILGVIKNIIARPV